MQLHLFGSCSGTEPFPGRHHTAFALEYDGRLYWFDAGECCSYTAHIMGVDVSRLRKVVISHPHIDHIGGLANLFWTVRKLAWKGALPHSSEIELFIPDLRCWQGILQTCDAACEDFWTYYSVRAKEYGDGLLFDDEGFSVTALHTRHLPHQKGQSWRAFGFLIQCEGKRVVYSGDTKGVEDFAPLMDGCDLLLMETGHHHPPEVARELLERGVFPDKLAFMHHGRDFLDRYDEQVRALDAMIPGRYVILNDAMTLEA